MRIKLIVLLLVIVGLISATVVTSVGSASRFLSDEALTSLTAATEVVRLENRIDDYSLIERARSLAHAELIIAGMQCPADEQTLLAQQVEQTPALDELGSPVVDELGRALDTTGRPLVERSACRTTAHQSVLNTLRDWVVGGAALRDANIARALSERDIGSATPVEPSLLIVADASGVIVARWGFNMDDWFGPTRLNMNDLPVVGRVMDFGPQHDVVAWRDHDAAPATMMQVASYPIYAGVGADRTFLGTVTVGAAMSNEWAEDDLWPLPHADIAYAREINGSLQFFGTTFSPEFLTAMQNGELIEQNPDGTEGEAATFSELVGTNLDGIYAFDYEGERYLVTASEFSSSRADQSGFAGFIIATSESRLVSKLTPIKVLPLAIALGLFFIGALIVLLLEKQFMAPIELVSQGVQEVIAGKHDHMWEVDERSHISDLSHSLNIMSARLQGKVDPDAEDSSGQSDWAGMVGGNPAAAKPAAVAGLGGLRGRRAKERTDDDTTDPNA